MKTDKQSMVGIPSVTFLGLYIDPKLTWEEHIHVLVKKLSSAYFVNRSIRDTVNL